MMGTYIQKGEVIDFVNSTENAIEAGEVVSLATRIGVAAEPIPAGGKGAVHVTGVFELPKASEALTVGDAVYFGSDGITATAGSNPPAGWAIEAAASTAETCKVKLLG